MAYEKKELQLNVAALSPGEIAEMLANIKEKKHLVEQRYDANHGGGAVPDIELLRHYSRL